MANEAKRVFNVSECVSDRGGVVVFVRKDGNYYCSDSFPEALKEIFNTRSTVEYIDQDNNFKTVRVDASVDADKQVITLHIPAEFGSNDKALRLMYNIEGEITAEEIEAGGGSGGSGGGMDVVIQCNSDTGMVSEAPDFTVLTGDYEKLKNILLDGATGRANVMLYMPWVYGGAIGHEQYTPCSVYHIERDNGEEFVRMVFDVSYTNNGSLHSAYLRLDMLPGNSVEGYMSFDS